MFAGNGKRFSSKDLPVQSYEGQSYGLRPVITQLRDGYPALAVNDAKEPLKLDSRLTTSRLTNWLQNHVVNTRVSKSIINTLSQDSSQSANYNKI